MNWGGAIGLPRRSWESFQPFHPRSYPDITLSGLRRGLVSPCLSIFGRAAFRMCRGWSRGCSEATFSSGSRRGPTSPRCSPRCGTRRSAVWVGRLRSLLGSLLTSNGAWCWPALISMSAPSSGFVTADERPALSRLLSESLSMFPDHR